MPRKLGVGTEWALEGSGQVSAAALQIGSISRVTFVECDGVAHAKAVVAERIYHFNRRLSCHTLPIRWSRRDGRTGSRRRSRTPARKLGSNYRRLGDSSLASASARLTEYNILFIYFLQRARAEVP
jgi:hypothetical protein